MENTTKSKIAQEKLMILYIIKKSNSTLTYNQLTNFILEFELLNYFTFVQYFSELSNSNFLEKWDSPTIMLTDFALQALELLEETIDSESRKTIDDIFSSSIDITNVSNARIIPNEDGSCIVMLSIGKEIDENFDFTFTTNNVDEAKKIEKAWYRNNKDIYKELLKVIKEAID